MQINTMVCTDGKSLADFPQMEQLIENVEEDDYMTLEETMEIGTRQYEQLNNKQKEIVDLVLNRLDTNNHNSNCIYYISMVQVVQVKHLYIRLSII